MYAIRSYYAIGIQGDWGIGKTSLMNMLRGSADAPGSGQFENGLFRCSHGLDGGHNCGGGLHISLIRTTEGLIVPIVVGQTDLMQGMPRCFPDLIGIAGQTKHGFALHNP